MLPIVTEKAPAAVSPYSQAIQWNGLLFVSGQLPIDPKIGKFNPNETKRPIPANLSVDLR